MVTLANKPPRVGNHAALHQHIDCALRTTINGCFDMSVCLPQHHQQSHQLAHVD